MFWVHLLVGLFLASIVEGKAFVFKKKETSPITFEQNIGQTDKSVVYAARTPRYNLYLTQDARTIYDVTIKAPTPEEIISIAPGDDGKIPELSTVSKAVQISFLGNNPNPQAQGLVRSEQIINYANIANNVPAFKQVIQKNLYRGIDLLYYGTGKITEHDFIVHPGADPSQIKFKIDGVEKLEVDPITGDLNLMIAEGFTFVIQAPISYQLGTNGETESVNSSFKLSGNIVSFNLGAYDSSRELVIDPATLTFSTYLGGSLDDVGMSIALDSTSTGCTTAGNPCPVVAGYTKSLAGSGFPSANNTIGTTNTSSGGFNGFVARLTSGATAITWMTYIGGASSSVSEVVTSITTDSNGNVYGTGYTTNNAYDALLFKLTASTGASSFSNTYGSTGFDAGLSIAVDTVSSGCTTAGTACPVILGNTAGLGTLGGIQTTYGTGISDAFVARFPNTGGSTPTIATYIGGDGRDTGVSLALDTSANVYVVGEKRFGSTGAFISGSSTSAPFKSCISGGASDIQDAFLVKMPPALTTTTYSGCFGGSDRDWAGGIALDRVSTGCTTAGSACAVVAGTTSSSNNTTNFTSVNAFQSANAGAKDVYLAKFNSTATTAFDYMTFMGGTGNDELPGLQGLAIDGNGEAWVTGRTNSSAFPTREAYQGTLSGASSNAFIFKIASGTTTVDLSFSSYFGGTTTSAFDLGSAILVDTSSSNAYIIGSEESTNFPTTGGVLDTTQNGAKDAFVSKLATLPITLINSATVTGSTAGTSVVINKPTNTADGDVMVAVVALNDDAATVSTAPTGWAQLANVQQAGGNNNKDGRMYVYWKLAASEGTNYTWSLGSSVKYLGGIFSFRNVNPTSSIHLDNEQATASATTHSTPSLDVTQYNTMLVTFHLMTEGNTWTPPTGMTEQFDIRTGTANNNDIGLEGSYVLQPLPGATGAKQATADEAGFGIAAIVALSER